MTKSSLLAAATFFVAAVPCIAQRAPSNQALAASIDSVVARVFAIGAAPGAGIVVVRDSQVVYAKGFGFADVEAKRPVTAETEFYIASVTKSFTGLAAAMMDQRGVLKLDEPISRYLPTMKLRPPLNADSMTVRSLLSHTHGIGDGPVAVRLAFTGEYRDDDELIALMSEHTPNPRGREYTYTNLGYNVVGFAMGKTNREPWKETLQRLIFTPLRMRQTSAYVSNRRAERLAMPYRITSDGFTPIKYGKTDANMQSAGGLITSANDMGRWLIAHINAGRVDGKQVIPAAAIAETHKVQAPISGTSRGVRMIGYGLGWEIGIAGADTLYRHGGGFAGFGTQMSFMPQHRVGVAVMTNNGETGGPFSELIAGAIYDVMLGRTPITTDSIAVIAKQITRTRSQMAAAIAQRAQRPQNLPNPLEAYTGTFRNPVMGTFELRIVNGKLEASMGATSSVAEVYDNTKDQLRVELFGNGEIVSVDVKNGRAESIQFQGRNYARVM